MKALKMYNFMGIPKHMARFKEVTAEQGLSMSAMLRQLIIKEIARAAKEAKATQ